MVAATKFFAQNIIARAISARPLNTRDVPDNSGIFDPKDIFTPSVKGAIWDYDDFSYLYQKANGSVPVTALEQPVGLVMDKRYGGARGSELITNGDFSNGTTGWTFNTATGAAVDGEAEVTATGSLGRMEQARTVVSGRWYEVTAIGRNGTATGYLTLSVSRGGAGGFAPLININGGSLTTPRLIRGIFLATGTDIIVKAGTNDSSGTMYFDNVSLRELPGLHAYQSTDAARPVLSARYNLLTATEDLAGASWAKSAAGTGVAPTVTNNFATAPDGTQTATRVQLSLGGGATSADRSYLAQSFNILAASHTTKVYIKANGAGEVGKVVAHRAAGGSAYTATTLTAEWQPVAWEETSATATSRTVEIVGLRGATSGSSATADVLVWHPDLRLTADANSRLPAYQRVDTPTSYDSAGFPRFLRIDATDDFLQTASVDPGTDKVFVCAGVTKMSDAATAMLIESSTSIAGVNGAFYITAPSNAVPTYRFASKGTAEVNATTGNSYAAPITSILSAVSDISGDSAILRVNGAVGATATTDQGTGNYTAQPIYIGARAGTTFRLNNGRIYPMVIAFKAVTAGEIAATEAWVNARTRAY